MSKTIESRKQKYESENKWMNRFILRTHLFELALVLLPMYIIYGTNHTIIKYKFEETRVSDHNLVTINTVDKKKVI